MKLLEWTTKCLKLKTFKQYFAAIESTDIRMKDGDRFLNTSMAIQFMLRFSSNISKEHQEILVFDGIDLLGSLGGALGLFIGFSFFGCATTFLEIVLEKAVTLFIN